MPSSRCEIGVAGRQDETIDRRRYGKRRPVLVAIGLAIATFAQPTRATDKGALTLEGGPSFWLGGIAPSVGSGDSVGGASIGAHLGVRYGLTDRFEVQIGGFWDEPGTLVHRPTTITTVQGSVSGALTQNFTRWGAAVGGRYAVTGLVWRLPVGFEIGWAHSRATSRDLLSSSAPTPTSLGLRLGDGSSDALSLAPFAGVEWLATDRLSFSVVPRLELLVGTGSTFGLVVPFTVGWSWYWF